MIHNFTVTGALMLSAYIGWKHIDTPFYRNEQTKMTRSLKKWALLLVAVGAAVMLFALIDPNNSKAYETYHSMSTVGFRILWIVLMGMIVLCYGVAQLAVHDLATIFHRFARKLLVVLMGE